MDRAKQGLQAQKGATSTRTSLGAVEAVREGQCPPLEYGKAAGSSLGFRLWVDLIGVKAGCSENHDTASTELLNAAKMSVLGGTWLTHLSFLYEPCRFTTFPEIFLFPSQMHCLHFYAFDTEASKIMHLITQETD